MTKYFLNVRRGSTIYEDRRGIDVPLEDAVAQAKELGREILRDEPEVPAQLQWIEVTDDGGNTVRTVPFVTI
jgi:hypothetical protein